MNSKIKKEIPPYFAKMTPELMSFKWDPYIQKVNFMIETRWKNISNFDMILIHWDYIFDDEEMINLINPHEKQFYYNVYFLEYNKGDFIRRHEKLFGDMQKLQPKLFQYSLL
jgi:hypothetical protein